jgi:hypothetical protein
MSVSEVLFLMTIESLSIGTSKERSIMSYPSVSYEISKQQ